MIGFAVDAFKSPLVVRRPTVAVEYVDGFAQPTTSWDEFEVQPISVQPVGARERQMMPELIRDSEILKAYTRCELFGVDVKGKVLADRVTYREKTYVVYGVEDWSIHGAYWKTLLVKEND